MNIIVVGCGKVGYSLASQLNKENHNVTIIDNNEKVLRHAVDSLDVMGINGNGAMLAIQQEAGVKNADVLIAATDSDEINMLCCLIAKKEGNCNTIARIRNPEYKDEINYLRDELNLAMVINPEMAAAKEVERLLRFPSVMKIDSFSRGKIDLIRPELEGKIAPRAPREPIRHRRLSGERAPPWQPRRREPAIEVQPAGAAEVSARSGARP